MSLSLLYFKFCKLILKFKKATVFGWIGALIAFGIFTLFVMQPLSDSFSIPNTESQDAMEQLQHTFPQVAGTNANLVVVAAPGDDITSAEYKDVIEEYIAELSDEPYSEYVSSPFEGSSTYLLSDDKEVAVISITLKFVMFSGDPAEEIAKENILKIADDLQAELPAGSDVAAGGSLYSISFPEISITEILGVLFALIVLMMMFGKLLTGMIPIITSLIALGMGIATIFTFTSIEAINSTTPMLAVMLGLAVGIDYALFIMSNYISHLRRGVKIDKAVCYAISTAGSAVTFAGVTVVIALVGLSLAFIPFLTIMGAFAAVSVAFSVLSAITFLPALLSMIGPRILTKKYRTEYLRKDAAGELKTFDDLEAREDLTKQKTPANKVYDIWFRIITKWPLVTIILIVALLGGLTLPAMNLRLTIPEALSLPANNTAKIAAEHVKAHFKDYEISPILITGSLLYSNDPLNLIEDIGDEFKGMEGVGLVPIATPNMDASQGVIQVLSKYDNDTAEAEQLVNDLRARHDEIYEEYGFDMKVTGFTPIKIDISAKLGESLVPFGVVVFSLSFLLLLMIFRSLYLPLAASLGFLLSFGSALGVTALFYTNDFLGSIIGITRMGSIISFGPLVVMSMLFGLAMDYQVFSGSMYIEEYLKTGDEHKSLYRSFMNSSKVIVAAFVIMFLIFVMFIPNGNVYLKPIALCLSVGILADAVLIRMVLMPAVDKLVGKRAFILPKVIDKYLPRIDIEGKAVALYEDAQIASEGDDSSIHLRGIFDQEFSIHGREPILIEYETSEKGRKLLLAIAGRLRVARGWVRVHDSIYPFASGRFLKQVSYVDLADTRVSSENIVRKQTSTVIVDGLNFLEDEKSVDQFIEELQAVRAKHPSIQIVFGSTGNFEPRLAALWASEIKVAL